MKSSEEIMEILEAYDLTGGFRAAAELAGCDHKTVAHYVALRDAGQTPQDRLRRAMAVDPFLDKVEEWVDRSNGQVRADVVHDKLVAMGFTGSDRSTRRAVAAAKKAWQAGHRRVFRPWIPEPGLWLQFDWGDGPRIAGRRSLLFCAWLAWSRFRVIIPVWDRTLPSLLACLDATLRSIGGAPTYALTDNEKTVTVEHIARVPVRHPDIVAAGRHYGMMIRTCVPADPQSKGGTEASVRIAKADLVPTEANLLEQYATFGELDQACRMLCEQVNSRPHRVTGRAPVEMLAEERARLHVLPEQPVTVAFGQTRRVCWDGTISVAGVRYSVPHQHVDERVWARWSGEELVDTSRRRPGHRPAGDRPSPARAAGPPADLRRALPGRSSQPPPSAWGADTPCREPGRGGVLGHRRRRGVLADRGGCRRDGTGPVEDGRSGRVRQAARHRRGRPGARHRGAGRPVRRRRPRLDPGAPARRAHPSAGAPR